MSVDFRKIIYTEMPKYQDEKLVHILEGTHEKEMGSWCNDGRKYFVDLSDSWSTFSNIS